MTSQLMHSPDIKSQYPHYQTSTVKMSENMDDALRDVRLSPLFLNISNNL